MTAASRNHRSVENNDIEELLVAMTGVRTNQYEVLSTPARAFVTNSP